MKPIEVRDLDAARRYVGEGLWLQRAVRPTAASARTALEWSLEIASSGQPLPPTGFVADVGHLALGADAEQRHKDWPAVPGWPPAAARTYEDHVLGKLYSDWNFERAGDALRRYAERERPKGVAFLVRQVRERGGIGGVELSPAVIRGLLAANPDEVLSQAWDGLSRDGPMPLLVEQYGGLVAAARRTAEFLAPEDAVALERRTALADMGQYVAHRQILQATARLASGLPARPVRPLAGRKEVPTRIADEDRYPVGGYTAISTRGSVESLLHSQLAYIEDGPGPDLFDLKFVRDELFYYSRDENQFLRRRRSFAFLFFPDLLTSRFKDPELPYQRIVMVQSFVLALIGRLGEWLSLDAIRFEVLFVQAGERKDLADEAALMELLLHESIARGDAAVRWVPDRAAALRELQAMAGQSQLHCLAAATETKGLEVEGAAVAQLVANGPRPLLADDRGNAEQLDADDAFDSWQATLERVLAMWI